MGSKVPPTTPSRRPATNRAYPGPGVPAREDHPLMAEPRLPGRSTGEPWATATGSPVQPVALPTGGVAPRRTGALASIGTALSNARSRLGLRPGTETEVSRDAARHTPRAARGSTDRRIDKSSGLHAVPSTTGMAPGRCLQRPGEVRGS